MALTIKNKQGFINDTLKRPSRNVAKLAQWDRIDMLFKAWLLGAMSKEISKSVMHCNTSNDMWTELKERFSHTNIVQLFETEKVIIECRQGNSSVTTYFTKLKALWDEKEFVCEFPTCTCAAAAEMKNYVDTQKAMQLLMGLSDNYASLPSTIISIDPLPPINNIYAMALRQEKQVDISNSKQSATVEASVFHAKKQSNSRNPNPSNPMPYNRSSSQKEGSGSGQWCEICQYTNHTAKNCRTHIKCTHCLGEGHSESYCKWKRMGHPKATRPPPSRPSSSSNYVVGGSQDVDTEVSLPQEDRILVIDILNRIKSGKLDAEGKKILELINNTTSSANFVGNICFELW